MMYREVDILSPQAVPDAATKTVDLDVTEPVTELQVLLSLTNAAGANVNQTPQSVISKIEIVDGGTVYSSLTGNEACAVYFYDAQQYVPHVYSEAASAAQEVVIPLRFGRYVGDPDFNFNPSALRNPQVKVTWAKAASHLTNTLQLGVKAKILEGQSPAGKCLFTKAVRSFVTAASGDEPTDLPTDYPLRRLFVRAYAAGAAPVTVISKAKVDCDQGKFVVLNWSSDTFADETEKAFGMAQVRRVLVVSDTNAREAWLGRVHTAYGSAADGLYIVSFTGGFTSAPPVHVIKHDGTAGANVTVEAGYFGSLVESTFAYQFGLAGEPTTWFPAPTYRNVKLILTQAAADAEVSILVQQARPVP